MIVEYFRHQVPEQRQAAFATDYARAAGVLAREP